MIRTPALGHDPKAKDTFFMVGGGKFLLRKAGRDEMTEKEFRRLMKWNADDCIVLGKNYKNYSEIKHILRTNGFTINAINRTFHAKAKPLCNQSVSQLHKGKIGYILDNPKDQIPQELQGVYEDLYSPNKQENKRQKRRAQTNGTSKTDNHNFRMTRTDDWTQNRLRKDNNSEHERISSGEAPEQPQQAARRATSTTSLKNRFEKYSSCPIY
ncbi:hypothetical protein Trydic_g12465 [Trypoxylus dichotomus]